MTTDTKVLQQNDNNYAIICRLCLERDGYMLSIFGDHSNNNNKFYILNKIFEFLQIEICNNDGLPNQICHKCLYKIELCTDFKKRCLHSNNLLRSAAIGGGGDGFNKNLIKLESNLNCNYLQFEEFSLKNQKFLVHNDIENVVTVVDPTVECDSDNDEPMMDDEHPELTENNQQQANMIVNNDDQFEQDNKLNDLKNVFMCQYCDRAFVSQEICFLHEQSDHDTESPFTCHECDMAFGDRINYTAHLKSVHKNDKPFGCPECDRAFGRRSDLRKHTIVHTGVKPFTCPICFKSFSRNTNLNKHLRIHSGYKPHVCPNCPRTFISKGDLSRHAMIHTGIRPFACGQCSQTFGRRDKLLRHEKRHLEPNESENMVISLDPFSNQSHDVKQELNDGFAGFSAEEVKNSLPYACTTCTKRFATDDLLKLHNCTPVVRAHACPQCTKTFVRKRELDRHMMTHTGTKPFVCTKCDKRFGRKDKLIRHMHVHDTVRNFSCEFCSATFVRRDGLNNHLRMHMLNDTSNNVKSSSDAAAADDDHDDHGRGDGTPSTEIISPSSSYQLTSE